MNHTALLRSAAVLIHRIEASGVDVSEISREIEIAKALEQMDKASITPKLEQARNDFTTENSFWLFLSDDDGSFAAVSARLDAIGREPIAEYWQRTYARYYGYSRPFSHIEESEVSFLAGRLVYVGEFHVARRMRGNLDMVADLAALVQILSVIKWEPDFVYAFVRDEQAQRGLIARYGFQRQVMCPRTWATEPPGRFSSEWLVANSATGVEHLARARSSVRQPAEAQGHVTTIAGSNR